MKRLSILGASGHGKVIADAALLSGWQEVVFYDDAWPKLQQISRWPVLGDTESLLKSKDTEDAVIVAIGHNSTRQQKSLYLQQNGFELATIIHPSALISQFAIIGDGSFIAASAVINVDANIGCFSIVNSAAIVEHDCKVGVACHVSPSAALAGGVCIGDCSWIGINACIRQLIKIGNNVVVGAGSTVLNDLPDGVAAVGSPAKILEPKQKC